MKKLLKQTSLVVLSLGILSSCGDFGNMNVDPNNVSNPQTQLLLTQAQKSVSSVISSTRPMYYVQYLATTQYDQGETYTGTQADFNGWYTGALKDLTEIIDLNESDPARYISGGNAQNQIAVARIMKVYFMQMMVDRWGPLPYSEALKGNDNFQPAYDDDDAIYVDLINELKAAASQINTSAVGVQGDIIFDGDMSRWIQFANSLRAKIALRMADANSSLAKSEFENAATNLITEDVMYQYLAESANENPWYSRYLTRSDHGISDVMDDFMTPKEDHRLTVYANPAPDFDNGDGITQFDEVIGMTYSILDPGSVTNSSISFPGAAIGAGGPGVGIQDAPLPILTVSEIHFMLSEAAARGWSVTGDAPTHYELAIKASWEQWGVYEEGAFNAYMSHDDVAFDAANYKKSIGEQKWVALFPNGYEAWAEWRRLGYPILTPHEYASNASGEIPVRFSYPASELTLNKASYEAALNTLGGPDDDQTHIFWDVD